MYSQLIERLRGAKLTLRRTSMPVKDIIPLLTEAADSLETVKQYFDKLAELEKNPTPEPKGWIYQMRVPLEGYDWCVIGEQEYKDAVKNGYEYRKFALVEHG